MEKEKIVKVSKEKKYFAGQCKSDIEFFDPHDGSFCHCDKPSYCKSSNGFDELGKYYLCDKCDGKIFVERLS